MGERVSISIDEWEGPLDVLLEFARKTRVDLSSISMSALVDACIVSLSSLYSLKDKADQISLAAELTLLKSRLLVPDQSAAEVLGLDRSDQERRLAIIQQIGARLMASDRLGRDVFARGQPERFESETEISATGVDVSDLILAYARLRLKDEADAPLEIRRALAMTFKDALELLGASLDGLDDWADLFEIVGQGARTAPLGIEARSIAASSFVAALEMARNGEVELRQGEAFGILELRKVLG